MLWTKTNDLLCFLFGPQSRRPGDGYSHEQINEVYCRWESAGWSEPSALWRNGVFRGFDKQQVWNPSVQLAVTRSQNRLSVFKAVRGHLMKHSLPNMRVLLHTLFVGVWWRRWGWGGGPLPRGSLLGSGLHLCWFHGLKKPPKGVDVEVVNACLICLMLNQKKSSVPQSIPPVCSESSVLRLLGNVLARQNAALFGFLFPAGETHGEYIFKKEKHVLKNGSMYVFYCLYLVYSCCPCCLCANVVGEIYIWPLMQLFCGVVQECINMK